jgi:hypothetical protein
MTVARRRRVFYGWRVVGAAFVLAVFGWGMGFYGPPVFLSVVRETRGWSLTLVSTAVTVHFLIGAVTGPICRHPIDGLALRKSRKLAYSAWLLVFLVGPPL